MNVMSFNTQHCNNFIEKRIDFELMAGVIKDISADIVGLNEMRGKGLHAQYTDQVKILARLTGMEYYFFARAIEVPNKGPYGNGFLSRIPILKAETILIDDPVTKKYGGYYESRCILKVELVGDVTVLVTHFGLNPDEQENAVSAVLDNISDKKCILMGDFNVTPDDHVLDPIREKMKDTADRFDGPRLSFPSDNPNRKIDYIFVSKDVEVMSANIPPIVASDHRPHVATVKL